VFCWKQGAQYRPADISTENFTAEDKTDLLISVARGLAAYVHRMIPKYPGSRVRFHQWLSGCYRSLKAQIDAWPTNLTGLKVNKLRSTQTAPKLDLEGANVFFRDFHRRFVVTKVDKLSHTMVAVCRKYYVHILHQDWQDSGFFCSLQGPMFTEKVLHDRVLGRLLPRFPFLAMTGQPKLAYAAVLVKMHKDPFAFRFLASCANYNLKKLGAWVTALCRGLETGVQTLWDKQISR
jgi:hypothetical protein